jgi:hypothetical protein
MAHMAAAHDIAYVSLYRALCPNGKCIDRQGEVPLFFDGGHFTKEGSILAATKIEQANPFWK